MKFGRISAALAIVAMAAVPVLAQAAGGADATTPSKGPFRHDVAASIPAVTDAARPVVNANEAASLRNLVEGVPISTTQDYGPTVADLPNTNNARVLFDAPSNGRVAGIASKRGDVCFTYAHAGRTMFANCIQKLNGDGLGLVLGIDGDAVLATGLAATNVSSITFELADGTSETASLANGAFAWRGESKNAPTSVTVARGGKATTAPIKAIA